MKYHVKNHYLRQVLTCSLLGLLTLSSVSCLEGDSKKKSPEATSAEQLSSAIRLKLSERNATSLRQNAEIIEVSVYSVTDGKRGSLLREPFRFPLSDDETYTLTDLGAGEVEIQVDLLGADNKALAAGLLRTNLQPGQEPLPEVAVEALPVPLQLRVQLLSSSGEVPAPAAVTEPAEVRAALKSASCLGCHSKRAKLGGLILDSYPYTSLNSDLAAAGTAAILNEMIARVTSTDAPMPPEPQAPMKAEGVAALEAFAKTLAGPDRPAPRPLTIVQSKLTIFLDEGKTLETQLLAQGGDFFAPETAVNVLPGRTYSYDLVVYGQDQAILYEVSRGSFEVPLTGQLDLQFKLNPPEAVLNQPLPDIVPR